MKEWDVRLVFTCDDPVVLVKLLRERALEVGVEVRSTTYEKSYADAMRRTPPPFGAPPAYTVEHEAYLGPLDRRRGAGPGG